MKRTYSQIDLDERRKIARWRQAGVSVDVIAEKLGLTGYFCVAADSKAKARRSRYRKLVRFPRLRSAIIERIKHGWSPEQIAGRLLERSSTRVCHETIYRFAYSSDSQEMKLWHYLPERRARRRPRHARRRHGRRFSPELSILHRPVGSHRRVLKWIASGNAFTQRRRALR